MRRIGRVHKRGYRPETRPPVQRQQLALCAQVKEGNLHSRSSIRSTSAGRSRRAGLPATTAPSGTSFVTTLPAPTVARSPMTTPQRIVAPEPIEAPRLTVVGIHSQSASVWRPPSAFSSPGKPVVDERHAVPDENLLLDASRLRRESCGWKSCTGCRPARPSGFPQTRRS